MTQQNWLSWISRKHQNVLSNATIFHKDDSYAIYLNFHKGISIAAMRI